MLNVKNRIPENDNDDDDIDDDADVDDDDGDGDGDDDDCDDIVRKPKTYDRSGRLCDFFGARQRSSTQAILQTVASKASLLRDLQWGNTRIPPANVPRFSTVGKHAYPTSYM